MGKPGSGSQARHKNRSQPPYERASGEIQHRRALLNGITLQSRSGEKTGSQYASLRLSERVAGASQSQRVDPYLSGVLRDGTQQNDAVLRLSGAVREGCDGR